MGADGGAAPLRAAISVHPCHHDAMAGGDEGRRVDAMVDRMFKALAEGDRDTANAMAGEILAVDRANPDAGDLLAAPVGQGELRRLTMLYADLVDSTELSSRLEPEVYRAVVGRYRELVNATVETSGGHIGSTKGDGLLAVFGFPRAHEHDVLRAVQAGLEITRDVAALSERAHRQFAVRVAVRVGVHRGLVYLDVEQDDLYGLAANLTARLSSIADPGTLVVSTAVEPLVRPYYDVEPRPAQSVKGIAHPVETFRVVTETRAWTRPPREHLVGRKHELNELRAAWAEVEGGGGATVLLKGEAGIGKSRLARTVVEWAQLSDRTVVELFGSPVHVDVGLQPVRDLLNRNCGIGRATSDAERLALLTAEIARRGLSAQAVVPLLAPVLGIGADAGYQPVQADGRKLREAIVAAVGDYLRGCLGSGSAVLLAEDVHWFDNDTLDVLRALVQDAPAGLLGVITSRVGVPLLDGVGVGEISLAPLNAAETDDLIHAIDPDMTAEQCAAVRDRCDGIPLYIEEIVAKMQLQPTDAAGSVGVPDSLYEALFARLNSVSVPIRVVEAAATIAVDIDRRIMLAVTELDEGGLDAAIAELLHERVLIHVGEDRWQFRHELLREVAAELAPPSLRSALHKRTAEALESLELGGEPAWSRIASHYAQAGCHVEAATAYERASGDARLRGALAEARTHLSAAIAQVEVADAGPERDELEVGLRLRRGFLAYAAEGASSENVASDYERCLQLSRPDASADQLMATLSALYGYYAIRAELDRVEQLLSGVREAFVAERPWFRPFNDAGFGMLAWYRGEYESARRWLANSAASRSDQDQLASEGVWFLPNEATASVYTHLALAHYAFGDLADAEAELRRTEQHCADLPFPQGPFSCAYARACEFLMRIDAGQLDVAASVAADLGRLSEQHGFDSWALVSAVQGAFAAALAAASTGADAAMLNPQIEALAGYIGLFRQLEVVALVMSYDAWLAGLMLAAGRPDDARERIDVGLAEAARTGMHYHDAELRRLRAQTFDGPQRRDELAAAFELARSQGALIYELNCARDDFVDRGEPARATLADVVGRFAEGSTWPPLARARELLGD